MTINIKYNYKDEFPSFPYVDLEIANINTKNFLPKEGKIDTGAYTTVIPPALVSELNLVRWSETEGKGIESDEYTAKPTYFVDIKINNHVFQAVEVSVWGERKNVLLGRNLLNLWKMIFDGKTHVGEAEVWSHNTNNAT